MKKLYVLIFSLLFFTLNAQIHIGSGSTSTTDIFPVYDKWYGNSYTQQIVLASEYQNEEGIAGPITQIKWKITSGAEDASGFNDLVVYLGHTTKTSFSSASDFIAPAALTSVFSGVVSITANNQWFTIDLVVPFNYNGTDNLVVAVFQKSDGVSYPYFASYTPSTSGNRGILAYGFTVDDNNPTASAIYSQAQIAQIQFTGIKANCLKPNNIIVSDILATSATISWTASLSNPAAGYEYEIRTSGAPGSGATGLVEANTSAAGVTTVAITNLDPNRTYNVFVRSNCGANDFNSWSNVVSFTTHCDAVNVPYTMPIDAVTVPAIPNCVTVQDANSDSNTWRSTTTPTGFTGKAMVYSSNNTANDWFYTQGLNLTAGQNYRLKFKYRNSGAVEKLKVSYGSGTINTAMITDLFNLATGTSSTTVEKIIDFAPTTSGVYYIGFQANTNMYQSGSLYVGDISVEESPTCLEVTAVSYSAVTNSTATISWSANALASPTTSYEYEIRTSGAPESGADGLVTASTTAAGVTTAAITNLAPNSTYKVYVRANCDANGFSSWSDAVSFTTLCTATNVPYTMPIDAAIIPAIPDCVTVQDVNNDSRTWQSTNTIPTGFVEKAMVYISNYNNAANDWLYTQGLNLTAGQNYRLKFKYKDSGSVEKLKVSYGAGAINTAMTTDLFNVTTGTSAATVEKTIDFTPTTSGVYFIGFQANTNGYQSGSLYIGDILVEESPTCLEVTSVSFSAVTTSTGTISLTANALASPTASYEYEIRTSGTMGSGSVGLFQEGSLTVISSTSLNISNLPVGITYTFYIKSNCGGGDFSSIVSTSFFIDGPPVILNNNKMRIGDGSVTSINSNAIMKQPFYYNTATNNWVQLTYGNRSFKNAIGINGAGANEWNTNGNIVADPVLNNISFDYSNYIVTATNKGYGEIIATGYTTIDGKLLQIKYTYKLERSSNYLVVTCSVKNMSSSTITNVRSWFGAQDDWIGDDDTTTKTKGNVVNNEFLPINNISDRSSFLKIESNQEGAFFYTTNAKSNTLMGSYSTAFETIDPYTSPKLNTNDGCYAIYTRLGDLAPNESEEYDVYYAAGLLTEIEEIITQVVNASGAVSNIKINSAVFKPTTNQEVHGYYVIVPNGALAPTAAEIITGTDYQGVLVVDSENKIIIPNANSTFQITGLVPTTDYTLYYVAVNESLNNIQSDIVSVNFTTLSPLIANISKTDVCFNSSNGIAKVEPTGGLPPYTYLWNNGATTREITNLMVGDYSVTVTDSQNNSITGNISTNQLDEIVIDKTVNDVSCFGQSDGSISLDILGGTGPYSYLWNDANAKTTATVTGLPKGIYTVIVTDAKGCSEEKEITVAEPALVTAPTAAAQEFCIAENKTVADLTTTSGTAVKWYDDATDGTALAVTTALTTGTTYYASQTLNGCESVGRTPVVVTIHNTAAPTANDQSFCIANNKTVADLSTTAGTAVKWYSAATGGTALAGTTALTTGMTYYASQTLNGCESVGRTPVIVTIHDTAAPTASYQSFCIAEDKTIGDLTATGTAVKWYDVATGGSVLATSEVLATKIYYATQTLDGCESVGRTPINVTIHNTAAPTATAQEFCITEGKTVGDLTATGAAIKWYDALTGGSALAISEVLETKIYYATQTLDGCESVGRTLVNVTIHNTAAPIATAQEFCIAEGKTVGDLTATGAAIKWYDVATGGSALAGTTVLTTKIYYATQTLNGCESVGRTLVNVTIHHTAAPIAAAQEFCIAEGKTVGDLTATGAAIKWYDVATGGSALAGTTVLTTKIYYATQTLNGCESVGRTPINVTIHNTAAPMATAQEFCIAENSTIANLVSTGTAIKWYDALTGGSVLAISEVLETKIYYASQTLNGCESVSRTPINVTIHNTAAPMATAQEFCIAEDKTIGDLTATGTAIKWYDALTDGSALAISEVLETKIYYATQTLDGCESVSRTPVNVTIHNTAAPMAIAQEFCIVEGKTVGDLTATGAAIKWYDVATGGSALAGTTVLTTKIYYATQTLNGCESVGRTPINVTIHNTAAPMATAQEFCIAENSTIANLVSTGTAIKWYDALTGGSVLAISEVLETKIYYASQTLNGCESVSRTPINVTIHNTAAPMATAQEFCIAEDKTIGDLTATGTAIKWYDALTDGSALAISEVLETKIYYATQTLDGCESVSRTPVNVTIHNTAAPMAIAQEFCIAEGKTVGDLTATGAAIKWYDVATGGSVLATSEVLTTKIYYASQTLNGCESVGRTPINVTIHNTAAPITTAQEFCIADNSTIANLVATGTAIKWYAALTGGSALAISEVLTMKIYYATQTLNGCESVDRTPVIVTIHNTAAPTATAQEFCIAEGKTVGDLTATGTAIKWYDVATGGSALVISEVLETKIYYASQTLNGCESVLRTAVNVTIPNTTVQVVSNQEFCAIDEPVVADIAINNQNVQWYANATTTTVLSVTTRLISGTYYVAAAIGNCYSERVPVSVIVNDAAIPTGEAIQYSCTEKKATIIDLKTDQREVVWYDAATGGTPLDFTTPLENNKRYYAAYLGENCESAQRLEVEVIQRYCDVRIHNGISANGDGKNDYLSVEGVTQFTDNTIEIFNSTGALVYKTERYGLNGNVFSGYSNTGYKSSGTLLSIGTYYYAFNFTNNDGKPIVKTGFLHLTY
ncbi:fibronectin type III domain-containing protein [Flavobacterium sp. W1B]|uniref:Ig-like domain-containing protein n=1 Tax=Flavobacterium sp. W1B TaxID=3394146 RepID=UPI0039BCD64E